MSGTKTSIPAFFLPGLTEADLGEFVTMKFGTGKDRVRMRSPVLTPALLSKVIVQLKDAREEYLSKLSVDEIIRTIDRVVALWRDPDYPLRRTAKELLPKITGYSSQMVTQALEQLLKDTNWKDLDYLIVDLPPGTGDTQLTLAQKVPVSGAVIITTPQDIALLDARKGLKMFEKVEVPVLGVIENMSIHVCSKCGHEEPIFGEGGGKRMAEEQGVDFLGALPLDIHIREDADSGKPTVVADPDSRIAQIYRDIARKTTARLALKGKNYSAKFPSIVIQNN